MTDNPGQHHPLQDPEMIGHMVRLMERHDAPREQYERLGLRQSG